MIDPGRAHMIRPTSRLATKRRGVGGSEVRQWTPGGFEFWLAQPSLRAF